MKNVCQKNFLKIWLTRVLATVHLNEPGAGVMPLRMVARGAWCHARDAKWRGPIDLTGQSPTAVPRCGIGHQVPIIGHSNRETCGIAKPDSTRSRQQKFP